MDKRFILNIVLAAFLLGTLTCCETIDTVGPDERGDDYYEDDRAQAFSPFDVTVFEHKNFEGRSTKFRLTRDKRQVLVPYIGSGMNDRISSIRCGNRVGLALFKHRDFEGPMVIYNRSIDLVDLRINDWASSLVIYDLRDRGPSGVWICAGGDAEYDLYNINFSGQLAFLPLPEEFYREDIEYRRIGKFNDRVDWVFLGPPSHHAIMDNYYRDRDAGRRGRTEYRRRANEVEVIVYQHANLRGKSVVFPPRGRMDRFFRLSSFGFSHMASSFIIRAY